MLECGVLVCHGIPPLLQPVILGQTVFVVLPLAPLPGHANTPCLLNVRSLYLNLQVCVWVIGAVVLGRAREWVR